MMASPFRYQHEKTGDAISALMLPDALTRRSELVRAFWSLDRAVPRDYYTNEALQRAR